MACTPAQRFIAALPSPLREATLDDAGLADVLAALVASGRAAWPDLEVADDDLLAHVARRLPADADPRRTIPSLCAADLYLAVAALRGVAGAVRAMRDGPLREANVAARRLGADGALADDVDQRVACLLLTPTAGVPPRLEQYAGRGSLRAFVRVIAARELARLRHDDARERPTEPTALFDALVAGDDPGLTYLKATCREAFRAAFEQAVADLSIHDRLLLRQHFLDGLTLDQVCVLHRVHRTTAARWLARVRDRLLRVTRRELQRSLALDEHEFEEILGLVRSQLDASLGRLLGADARPSPRRR